MICARPLVSYFAGFCLVIGVAATAAHAEVDLAPVFGDHMVLQRDQELAVWGRATPGEPVTVALAGRTAATTAGAGGRWRVTLPAMQAGGPHTLTATGADGVAATVHDVLVGEVWLCAGQSNMEFPVRAVTDAALEIQNADHPQIREFTVPHVVTAAPQDDVPGAWTVCTPASVGGFTACGYFMAVRLHEELGVPIGLVSSNWGGTRIEPWTPPIGFERVPALADIARTVAERSPDSPAYREAADEFVAATERWTEEARRALESGAALPAPPTVPERLAPPVNAQSPAMLYYAMIHGLVGYPLRGAIWYQGESNVTDGPLYADKMRALIEGWRVLWGIGDFPFYFVQLAPFRYGDQDPDVLPELWEAQSSVAREIPNTGMVVVNDIATADNIHPPDKQDVGRRLADMALRRTYGMDRIVDSGPTFASLETKGNTLHVKFDHAEGLAWRDGRPGADFQIMGPGSAWVAADAKVRGDTVVLSHKDVRAPCAVRFAWHKLAEPRLVNGAGLPTGAFRAGQVPRPDALGDIHDAAGYTTVLDIDLKRLAAEIRYDADLRSSVTVAFDRIAYLVELETPDGAATYVWVSMDAFTDDLAKVGIPTAVSGSDFAVSVANMNVESNVRGLPVGRGRKGGNLEFWPSNYAAANGAGVPGAADDIYDFGDRPGPPRAGYGCMQVHDHIAGQTIFAVNHWSAGRGADLGIGNSPGTSRDWTFAANAATYRSGRLRVFVRTK